MYSSILGKSREGSKGSNSPFSLVRPEIIDTLLTSAPFAINLGFKVSAGSSSVE